jgi:hypothetical protein
MLQVEKFEPVYLEIGECKITEYGKGWLNRWMDGMDRFNNTIKDVAKVALKEIWDWPKIQRQLDAEGVPQMISSGISQYAMAKLIDHLNGKTPFTMPATVAMALATAAPTSTTTGATVAEPTVGAYTGYGRQTIINTGFNAASTATPSVATNSGAITFGNCTAGTGATLLGFILADSATIAAGNSLWYGTLTSVTISTTQTPPTVGSGVMNLSMTGV